AEPLAGALRLAALPRGEALPRCRIAARERDVAHVRDRDLARRRAALRPEPQRVAADVRDVAFDRAAVGARQGDAAAVLEGYVQRCGARVGGPAARRLGGDCTRRQARWTSLASGSPRAPLSGRGASFR